MSHFTKKINLSACALATLLVVSACGGGADGNDVVPPTVQTITSAANPDGKVAFTFTFSESIQDRTFTIEDVVVTGGDPVSLAKVDATHYVLTVTPTTGALSVSVAANKFQDRALNFNTAPASHTYTNSGTATKTVLVTFDAAGTTYTLTGFGGAEDSTVVVDPSGGTNKVAKVIKSATAELWAGTTVSTGANQSLATIPLSSTNKTMTLRVWAPAAGIPVRLKLEDAADGSHSVDRGNHYSCRRLGNPDV